MQLFGVKYQSEKLHFSINAILKCSRISSFRGQGRLNLLQLKAHVIEWSQSVYCSIDRTLRNIHIFQEKYDPDESL